jgi:hypothetical protein
MTLPTEVPRQRKENRDLSQGVYSGREIQLN